MTILRLRGLGKRYGGLPAVAELDLDVADGSVLAVIGPNGAGKSTLLALLNGTVTPTTSDGMVFAGTDLTGLPPHTIRRLGVATVLQTPRAFDHMTVLENVMLAAMFAGATRRTEAEARSVAVECLADVDLGGTAEGEVERLTLHQRRRLELARALAGDPRLLLLDEPMAGLNATELGAHVERIRRLRDQRGMTIVWVEHVMAAVTALADEVAVLNVGCLIAKGPPRDVVRDEAVIEAYLGSRRGNNAHG